MPHKFEIPSKLLKKFNDIGEHLKCKNRFTLPKDLNDLVESFVKYQANKIKNIYSETLFYRARIEKLGQETSYPATNQDMGAPPKGTASSGRINPEGISYLYLANSIETAIAEVRPWKMARVSVANFELSKDLTVVSLVGSDSLRGSFDIKNDAIKLFISAIIKNMYFSAPAHGSDKLAYLASQYIAEQIKFQGIDGIEYPSVLRNEGINTVFFDPDVASCTDVRTYCIGEVIYNHKAC